MKRHGTDVFPSLSSPPSVPARKQSIAREDDEERRRAGLVSSVMRAWPCGLPVDTAD